MASAENVAGLPNKNGGGTAGESGSSAGSGAAEPACDPALLSLLVCPYTKTSLGYDASRQELISRPERLAFPIRDGIPILVREEARSLDDIAPRT